jgi:hypothetical protein
MRNRRDDHRSDHTAKRPDGAIDERLIDDKDRSPRAIEESTQQAFVEDQRHAPTGAPGNEHLEPRSTSAESRNEIEIDQRNREPGSEAPPGKRPKGPTTHDITSMNQTGD